MKDEAKKKIPNSSLVDQLMDLTFHARRKMVNSGAKADKLVSEYPWLIRGQGVRRTICFMH